MTPKVGEKWRGKQNALLIISGEAFTITAVDPLNNQVYYRYDNPGFHALGDGPFYKTLQQVLTDAEKV